MPLDENERQLLIEMTEEQLTERWNDLVSTGNVAQFEKDVRFAWLSKKMYDLIMMKRR